MIVTGSTGVLIDGLPAARLGDRGLHAIVADGSLDVAAYGGTFAMPANFTIVAGDADFKQMLIRDLFVLTTLKSGQELIRRLVVAGQPVGFQLYTGPKPNSTCTPTDYAKVQQHEPTGSTVAYDPTIELSGYGKHGETITMPPQVVLGHEMAHALANAEGTHHLGIDPNPPASELTIPEEEAHAIGVGSHASMSPSENSLRRDLGLPERGNHQGEAMDPDSPYKLNLRPGGP